MRFHAALITVLVISACGTKTSKETPTDEVDNSNNVSTQSNGATNNGASNNVAACEGPGCVCEPGDCSDGDVCTQDSASFDPDTCQTLCTFVPLATCNDGDGCCPSGCTYADDSDCVCTPTTCAELGRECGPAVDGCGADLECGECAADETCSTDGRCEARVAPSCTVVDDCPAGFEYCVESECKECVGPTDCEEGAVCTGFCDPSPDCSNDPDICPDGYGCDGTTGLCQPHVASPCDPSDPMSCLSGSVCDPATNLCSEGCGFCNDDCTCDGDLVCDGFFCTGCDPIINTCPDGQTCLPIQNICLP